MTAHGGNAGPFSAQDSSEEKQLRAVLRKAERVREGFWRKLKGALRRIPFAEDLVAAYYCAMDSETPTRVRATLLSALGYFILPTDALPDFIVGLGYTDDAAVLSMAISMVAQHIKPKHRKAAQDALKDRI